MNIMKIVLALSITTNLFSMAYIAKLEGQISSHEQTDTISFSQQECTLPDHANATTQAITDSEKLENRITRLQSEYENCQKSLKDHEFKITFQKLNQQYNSNSLITIDENLPDDLQATISTYSAYIEEETIDEKWSHDVTTTLETIVDREKYQELTIVSPINCRSTLCNYEIVVPNQQQANQIETLLKTSLTGALGGEVKLYQHTEADFDDVTIIMYYAREGHALPALDY
jgi:hypothetical protein